MAYSVLSAHVGSFLLLHNTLLGNEGYLAKAMKIIEVVTADRTYFINADEVAYVEYSVEPKPYANIHFRGFEQEGKPRSIHLTAADADSFVKKLRVVGSVY
jgi:hypothetical protein